MKKPLVLLAAAGTFASPAFAGPCVALDYQEMKDMSVEDLAKEACKARDALSANMKDIIANLGHDPGKGPFPAAQESFDICKGQIDRIDRVLVSKGVEKEKIPLLCDEKDTAHPSSR